MISDKKIYDFSFFLKVWSDEVLSRCLEVKSKVMEQLPWTTCPPSSLLQISFPLAYCRNVSLARQVSWTFHPSLIVTACLARNAKSSILFSSIHRKGCQFPGIFVVGCTCHHHSFAMLLPSDCFACIHPKQQPCCNAFKCSELVNFHLCDCWN